jgi:hypothetical protein
VINPPIVAELLAALKKAKRTIQAWHGKDGWEIYDRYSPEMKIINAAIAKAQTAEGGEGLELAKRILKLKGGTNIMSEKLCPICNSPSMHKKGCPYPLAEKLVKKIHRQSPLPPALSRQGRGRKDSAMSEHVQALDFNHDKHDMGIIRIALIDSLSGVIITEAVPNIVLVKAAIHFLQRVWRSGAPEVLTVDGSPVFKTRTFRSFVEGEGVKLRILSPADRELRWKLESTFFPRVAA